MLALHPKVRERQVTWSSTPAVWNAWVSKCVLMPSHAQSASREQAGRRRRQQGVGPGCADLAEFTKNIHIIAEQRALKTWVKEAIKEEDENKIQKENELNQRPNKTIIYQAEEKDGETGTILQEAGNVQRHYDGLPISTAAFEDDPWVRLCIIKLTILYRTC